MFICSRNLKLQYLGVSKGETNTRPSLRVETPKDKEEMLQTKVLCLVRQCFAACSPATPMRQLVTSHMVLIALAEYAPFGRPMLAACFLDTCSNRVDSPLDSCWHCTVMIGQAALALPLDSPWPFHRSIQLHPKVSLARFNRSWLSTLSQSPFFAVLTAS